MNLDTFDEELKRDHDDEVRMELAQESREEPFYEWVKSLTDLELIEAIYGDRNECVGSNKDVLMKAFHELD